MGEDFIDALSTEQLNEYANSKSIVATEAFIKTDAEGNSTFVTESEAQSGARGFVPPGASEDDLNDPGNPSFWLEERTDEYMELVFIVSYKGNGVYHYSVDAEWLQSPFYYFTDSLGACAQNCSVINETRTGWRTWTAVSADDPTDIISDTQTLLSNVDFENDDCAGWFGTAAKFAFPTESTMFVFDNYYFYTEMKVHVEFDATVSYPNNESYFYASATYAHHHLVPDIIPSIEIIVSEDEPVSIGIAAWYGIEYRNVAFTNAFHYVPDN